MSTDEPSAAAEGQSADVTDPATVPPKRRRFRMSGKKWLLLSVAFVVLVAAGVGGWMFSRSRNTAANQTTSRTVQATLGTQTQTVSLDGTLSPRKQSDVNFAVSGTITTVYVKAGDTVSKGQKLARVDDTDLQDAVDVASANLTTANANYDEVVDNDGSSAAIASAKAQVSSAKAALTSAKQDLANAVLRSPIAGTVAAVNADEGDSVTGSGSSSSSKSSGSGGSSSSGSGSSSTTSTTSTAQFSVISTATWKLEGTVGSADLGSLKAGQSVEVTPSGATEAIKGTVASVGIVATSTSDGAATFPVVINLSGTHKDLYSGTTGTAVITTGSYDNVLTVPTAAIRTENGKTVVTKVNGTATSTVEVTVGKVFGTYTQITKGLSEGDSVQITFTRPSGTSSSGTNNQNGGGFGGGGFGGGGLGGGQPPGGVTGGNGPTR
ncbi:Efflux transporter, RND family, MFP subunit [Micropruina glycogenica]|uniref:Efflux transporter, RND family, MFP subunit n=2 Tax=Micropruina glycogenica TaxID=75385 RepID=A0A2N9JD12_9ACTN|nr:Efflux transporter, RND family, MFP subunit [Micropruina glycogenica]